FHPYGNGLNIPGEKSLNEGCEGIRPNRSSPNLSKKKNNTSLLYLSSFISKRSKRLYFLFLTAEKGTKRLPAGAPEIQFYAARFTTRFAQTSKNIFPP
ncbi:hypothetical protein, partial [Candidatus Avelusimicrobium alvi]|uniref:hypothetical protein n=1 Tax=Candidatus Avelusimicrobium alvi TaxID=3416221 RepID=UPI003D0A110D